MGANSFDILNNLDSSNGMVCRKDLNSIFFLLFSSPSIFKFGQHPNVFINLHLNIIHRSGLPLLKGRSSNFKHIVRPDMRYYFRSGRFCPNPRTKHISDPPRHTTKPYVPDFTMISQHYNYKGTTSYTIGIQVPEYNTSTEDTCLGTDYNQCL